MTTEDWVATCDSYFNTTGTTAADFLAALGHPGDGRLTRLLAMTDPAAQPGTESTVRVRLNQKDRDRDRKAVVGGWITLRLTYDDVLFGWDEVLQDIRAITGRGRHRARSANTRAAIARSQHAAAQLQDAQQAARVARGE